MTRINLTYSLNKGLDILELDEILQRIALNRAVKKLNCFRRIYFILRDWPGCYRQTWGQFNSRIDYLKKKELKLKFPTKNISSMTVLLEI